MVQNLCYERGAMGRGENTVRELSPHLLEESMKGNGRMTKWKGKEHTLGVMETSM